MKIGDLLLLKGVINKKQLQAALSKQAEEAITYNRSVPLGRILIISLAPSAHQSSSSDSATEPTKACIWVLKLAIIT